MEEEFYQIELPIQAVRVIHTGLSQVWTNGLVEIHKEQEELLKQ